MLARYRAAGATCFLVIRNRATASPVSSSDRDGHPPMQAKEI